MKSSIILSIISLLNVLLMTSCTSLKDNILIEDLENDCWDKKVELLYENTDTISEKDVIFLARYDKSVRQNAVSFTLNITSPLGYVISDTVSVVLPKDDPKRVTLLNCEQKLIEKAHFDMPGVYSFELEPVGDEGIDGIYSIGIAL